MVDMDELVVLATDEKPVRRYLRRIGIPERDITAIVDSARHGEPVIVNFGIDDEGMIPPLQLRCPGGSDFELVSASPAK